MPKEILKGVYLFNSMGSEQLALLSRICEIEILAPKHQIFQEGDEAKALYIIRYGTVDITHFAPSGDIIHISTLGSGDHFGEISFIDRRKRSSSAETLERSEIISIPFTKLGDLLEQQPLIAARFYQALSKSLSARLNMTTDDLSFAREQNLKHHS